MATSVSVNRGSESSFDCEFVEKPPVIQSECPVCLQILCEPYQVSCCGYSFCRVCIERLKSNNKPCPTCKEENFTTFHNKGLQRSLYEFQVYCSHKQEGCEWKGELGQLDNHLNLSPQPDKRLEGCGYSEIECIYCSELIKRCNIAVHQTDLCPKRPFSCEYCHSYETHYEDVVNSHWPVCGYHPVQCPNECGTFPLRQSLENHITRDCPKTVIDCDFHHVGCDVRLPRKDMPAHLNENLVTHMSLQAASYSKLLASHSGLLATLQQKVNKLESKNETLKASHTTLQASHNKLRSELQDKVRMLKIENETFKQQLSRMQVSSKNENAQCYTATPMPRAIEPTMQQRKSSKEGSNSSHRQAQPIKMKYTRQYTAETSGRGGAHYPVQQMQYQTVQCKADDCNNPIHFEMGTPPGFGAFEYCSPQCRDRHMLPGLQVQLQQDIQALQEIASHSTTSATDYRSYSAVTDDGSPETSSKSKRKSKEEKRASLDKKSTSEAESSSKSNTSENSSTRTTTKHLKNVKVIIKEKDKDTYTSIIVGEEIFTCDDTMGFLITGVVVGSKAYKLFQDDKLRLLDVVRTVNGKPVVPGDKATVQEQFNNMFGSSAAVVTLDIHRSIALPPISKQLKEASKKVSSITHVLAMRPPQCHGKEEFGMRLQDRLNEVHVVECKAKYPAHLAGLRDDDSIRACVVATKTEFEPLVTAVTKTKDDKSLKFEDKLAKTLQQAAEERKEVILFIARWEQNTDTQL